MMKLLKNVNVAVCFKGTASHQALLKVLMETAKQAVCLHKSAADVPIGTTVRFQNRVYKHHNHPSAW
jgi:hypothetical protein